MAFANPLIIGRLAGFSNFWESFENWTAVRVLDRFAAKPMRATPQCARAAAYDRFEPLPVFDSEIRSRGSGRVVFDSLENHVGIDERQVRVRQAEVVESAEPPGRPRVVYTIYGIILIP